MVSKFLSSTLSHSCAMCIFSYRRAQLSLKEAFRVIFARNCNDRRRCRVSPSPIILSSSYSLLDFSSFFFSLVLPFYLSFLFRLGLRVRPCNATTLPISSSRDHLLLRPLLGPVRSRPVKVAIEIPPFVNFSNRFQNDV